MPPCRLDTGLGNRSKCLVLNPQGGSSMLFRHAGPTLVASLLLLLTAACATSSPDPTPDISATVSAEVQGQLAAIPTATPQPTHTPAPTTTHYPTYTPVPTTTPSPTPTKVPTATLVPIPTPTLTPSPTPRPTITPRPAATPLPTNTPMPTETPRPTSTPRPTATPKPMTGNWYSWEEVQELGWNPEDSDTLPRIVLFSNESSSSTGTLHADCQVIAKRRTLELYVSWHVWLRPVLPFGDVRPPPFVTYKIDGKAAPPPRQWINGEKDPAWDVVFAPPTERDVIVEAMLDGADRLEVTIDSESAELTFSTFGFQEAVKPVLQACDKPIGGR